MVFVRTVFMICRKYLCFKIYYFGNIKLKLLRFNSFKNNVNRC
jgi:hypothetical protein